MATSPAIERGRTRVYIESKILRRAGEKVSRSVLARRDPRKESLPSSVYRSEYHIRFKSTP